MKYLVVIAEGILDEPVESLENRTPLEIAKTPTLDVLARKGRLGLASFVPHELPPTPDVACFSLLGYDPKEHYTGIAPLQALAMGIQQKEGSVAFRCDLVTALDDVLVDAKAGGISPKEAKLLISVLNERLAAPRMKIHAGEGYKTILIADDSELADDLDDLECVPPARIVGQKLSKHLPKGKAEKAILSLMDRAKAVLEEHEINRVRIDLKENPANLIWPWGQGKRPKPPAFRELRGPKGALAGGGPDYLRGLAKAAGLDLVKDAAAALAEHDFVIVYLEASKPRDLKARLRAVEELDAFLAGALKAIEKEERFRILVTTPLAETTGRGPSHGTVPYLLYGAGIEGENAAGFSEKTAAHGRHAFPDGYELIQHFLKR